MNACPRCRGGLPDDPTIPTCQCGTWWTATRKDITVNETADWLKSREDWLRVVALPSRFGGFDVALIIDGSYSLRSGPRRIVGDHAARIKAVLEADGRPLRRALTLGVASLLTPEAVAARNLEHRKAATARAEAAIAARDIEGMISATADAMAWHDGESGDLEHAFRDDGHGEPQ